MRPRAAAGEGLFVNIALKDVAGRLVSDPAALFTFRRLSDQRQIGDQVRLALRGASSTFSLEPVVGDVVVCDLDLQRYRFARSPVFFRTPGPQVRLESVLLREPSEWRARFTPWAALAGAFGSLKTVLDNSPDVILRKQGTSLGKLVDAAYDGIADAGAVLAKTALLNVSYRLRSTQAPLARNRDWFSYVQRILAIDRERFLAFVDPEMETIVRHVHDHIDDFRADYELTNAQNHRGNVPADLQSRISRMTSIKSSHDTGNFQLTITHLERPDEVLLDADIDESGRLLAHFADLFRHRITGGTHPHDVHEILIAQDGDKPGFDLGYRLV